MYGRVFIFAWSLLVSLSLVDAGAKRASLRVTPVEKVIELLNSLRTNIQDEGKEQAAEYDKYSCFCKEQADEKLYAIETSEKKMEKLNAKIAKLSAEIATLTDAIKELSSRIDGLDREIKAAVDLRNHQHDGYLQMDSEMVRCIAALESAIQAVKDSKSGMSDAKLDLAQLKPVAEQALSMISGVSHLATRAKQLDLLKTLSRLSQPGHAYEFQSNDIIATLENLLDTFKGNKMEMDQEEFETRAAYEKRKLGMENEKKFAEQEKMEKEEVVSSKGDEKETAETELTEETKDKNADQAFLDELTSDCESKAADFDQSSKTRAAELTMISEAIEKLETEASPNYGVNKKLVGIQKASHVGHWVYVEDNAKPPTSFLQLRGSGPRGMAAATERVLTLLTTSAAKLKSTSLTALAAKVTIAKDHFVEVRGLIKELIAKLEAQAENEATLKSYCDEEMSKAVTSRDQAQMTIEDRSSAILALGALIKQIETDIATISKNIAELNKSLNEAKILRVKEKADNEAMIAEAKAGKEAVQFAINLLREFYEGQGEDMDSVEETAFIQHGAPAPAAYVPYVAPGADREGKTVADLAPEGFKGGYEGRKEPAKNILGLLEVIKADFERTETMITEEEAWAAEDEIRFEADVAADLAEKQTKLETETTLKVSKEDEMTSLTDEKKEAQEMLQDAEKSLEGLRKMCIEGEETYEERTGSRKKEIEALKEALKIFEDWQS